MFILFLLFSLPFLACSSGTDSNQRVENGVNFNSGNIADGESFSFTFEEEATVPYYCQIHAPNMQGTVIVSSDAEISGDVEIVIEGLQFNPSSITITPGTTVTWVNQDGTTHNILDGNPSDGGDDGGGPNY